LLRLFTFDENSGFGSCKNVTILSCRRYLSLNMHSAPSLAKHFFSPVLSLDHQSCLFFYSLSASNSRLFLFLSRYYFFSSVELSDSSLGWPNGALPWSLSWLHQPSRRFLFDAAAEVKADCTAGTTATIDQSERTHFGGSHN